MEKKLFVELSGRESIRKRSYQGRISYSPSKVLDYKVEFDIYFKNIKNVKSVFEYRQVIPITISHKGEQIALTDDQYVAFFQILVPFVAQNQVEMETSQDGIRINVNLNLPEIYYNALLSV